MPRPASSSTHCSVLCSCSRALGENRELRNAYSRLELSHPPVVTDGFVLVASAHTLVPEKPEPIGERIVARRDDATLACRHVLRRVQGEAPDSETTGTSSVAFRQVCLSSVLDERQTVTLTDLHDRPHVGAESVEVHRHDRPRAVGNRCLEERRIDAVVIADVDESHGGTSFEDRVETCHEGERRRDDLIARFEVERLNRRNESTDVPCRRVHAGSALFDLRHDHVGSIARTTKNWVNGRSNRPRHCPG